MNFLRKETRRFSKKDLKELLKKHDAQYHKLVYELEIKEKVMEEA